MRSLVCLFFSPFSGLISILLAVFWVVRNNQCTISRMKESAVWRSRPIYFQTVQSTSSWFFNRWLELFFAKEVTSGVTEFLLQPNKKHVGVTGVCLRGWGVFQGLNLSLRIRIKNEINIKMRRSYALDSHVVCQWRNRSLRVRIAHSNGIISQSDSCSHSRSAISFHFPNPDPNQPHSLPNIPKHTTKSYPHKDDYNAACLLLDF